MTPIYTSLHMTHIPSETRLQTSATFAWPMSEKDVNPKPTKCTQRMRKEKMREREVTKQHVWRTGLGFRLVFFPCCLPIHSTTTNPKPYICWMYFSTTCTSRRFPGIGNQESFNHQPKPNLHPTAIPIHWETGDVQLSTTTQPNVERHTECRKSASIFWRHARQEIRVVRMGAPDLLDVLENGDHRSESRAAGNAWIHTNFTPCQREHGRFARGKKKATEKKQFSI